MIKKISQNTTWIEADILDMNLNPHRYNALAPDIVYVSNDVTIPFNSVTSKNVTASAREWDRNRYEIYGSALELISISLCTRANTWMFDGVNIRVIRWNCFSKMWRISLPGILQNNDLQCQLKRRGDHKRRLSTVHYIAQCTVFNARWRNNALQTML